MNSPFERGLLIGAAIVFVVMVLLWPKPCECVDARVNDDPCVFKGE